MIWTRICDTLKLFNSIALKEKIRATNRKIKGHYKRQFYKKKNINGKTEKMNGIIRIANALEIKKRCNYVVSYFRRNFYRN